MNDLINLLKFFISSENASCLFNNPAANRTDKQLLRVLPGKYITYDEQCQKLGYQNASSVSFSVIHKIFFTSLYFSYKNYSILVLALKSV